jgi:hypothetical protein
VVKTSLGLGPMRSTRESASTKHDGGPLDFSSLKSVLQTYEEINA